MKWVFLLGLFLCMQLHCSATEDGGKKRLQGSVTHQSTNQNSNASDQREHGAGPAPTRLTKRMLQNAGLLRAVPMSEEIDKRKKANANFFGFADPADTKLDVEAEAGSKELMLAWEKWHKATSEVLYKRFCGHSTGAGKVTTRITVTKDRAMTIEIVSADGSPTVQAAIEQAVRNLSGNPGLSFPALSKRNVVTFDKVFICSPYITPGFTWKTDDFEQITVDK